MEILQSFLNLITFPLIVISLGLVMPPYIVGRLISFLIRSSKAENVQGKVVLITGASSGIGEHVAYEYAKRGACLALAARRQDRLREVAAKARQLGSPDVIVVTADVSKVRDCERMIDETIDHFHKLDHLVNNAGFIATLLFEDYSDITVTRSLMDVNFWGSVYTTKFAAPHLRRSKGKIAVMASSASWSPTPRLSIYNATKGAMVSLFDTLRVEFGGDVKITLVTPGFIETEVTTKGKTMSKEGDMQDDREAKNLFTMFPIAKVEGCAQAIVRSVCRGDRYLTMPVWYYYPYMAKLLAPELLDLFFKIVAIDLYNKIK